MVLPTPAIVADPIKALDAIVMFKPGAAPGTGAGGGDKALTAVLLNPADNSLIAFGDAAREKFATMCDSGVGT